MVLMAHGSTKPIKYVGIDEMILAKDGRAKRIRNIVTDRVYGLEIDDYQNDILVEDE